MDKLLSSELIAIQWIVWFVLSLLHWLAIYPVHIAIYPMDTGFSLEGGTRRLIAAYFGIYSRLLCWNCFSFLCFVLQVYLSCFLITLLFIAWLWSKQNQETCLLFWTRSIKPFYLSAGLHGERWERVRMFQNGGQAYPTWCRKNLLDYLASLKADQRKLKV